MCWLAWSWRVTRSSATASSRNSGTLGTQPSREHLDKSQLPSLTGWITDSLTNVTTLLMSHDWDTMVCYASIGPLDPGTLCQFNFFLHFFKKSVIVLTSLINCRQKMEGRLDSAYNNLFVLDNNDVIRYIDMYNLPSFVLRFGSVTSLCPFVWSWSVGWLEGR